MTRYKIGRDLNIHTKENTSKQKQKSHSNFVLAKYAGLGYYLVTPLVIGVFLGFGLDSYFGSKPFFILFFIIIGFISAIYNMYRLIKEEELNSNATRQHQS